MASIAPRRRGRTSIERLSLASARRVIEPEVDLPGRLGLGRLVADDLLSVAGTDLDLTSDQRVLLSREEVAAYHCQEEARHLSFARSLLSELLGRAPRRERFLVRHLAPIVIEVMFDSLVHAGLYRRVGLAGWATWWKVKRSPGHLPRRHQATTAVLEAALAAGALGATRPRPQELAPPGRSWVRQLLA